MSRKGGNAAQTTANAVGHPAYLPWPRLRMAVQRAHEVLLKLDPLGSQYGPFPVNMDEVASILGIRFVPASAVHSTVGGQPINEALCMRQDGITVVLVPEKNPPGRLMFDAAHEAGHVACAHFDEYNIPALREEAKSRKLARKTLAVLDREADVFAAELLMPLAVVRYLKLDALDLQFYHCVSYTAASNRVADIDDPRWLEITAHDEDEILDHCREYIDIMITMKAVRGEW